MTDDEREACITRRRLEFQTAHTPEARRVAWDALADAIKQRTPAQVERMEREKGLR